MTEYTLKLAGPDPKDPRVPLSGSLVRRLLETLDSGAPSDCALRGLARRKAAHEVGYIGPYSSAWTVTRKMSRVRLSAPSLGEVIPPSLRNITATSARYPLAWLRHRYA